jgi:hypothetical protein
MTAGLMEYLMAASTAEMSGWWAGWTAGTMADRTGGLTAGMRAERTDGLMAGMTAEMLGWWADSKVGKSVGLRGYQMVDPTAEM